MAMDPVCHMEVDELTAMWESEHKGKHYYFCARVCKDLFERDPEMWTD